MQSAAAALVTLLAIATPAIAADPPLQALQWLAADAGPELIAAVTTAPVECFRALPDRGRAEQAEAGRIIFRSPLLLGGPAARSGISCNTCHVNGHDNPQFFIAGLSGAPGSVDVSSRRFSKTRGDDVFDPRPIPSLTALAAATPDHAEARPAIARFVHGVIVDEFQGWQPAPAVMDALLAYVAALDPAACRAPVPRVPIRLADELARIDRGVGSLLAAIERGDAALADFLLISLRSLLGDIHQHFEADDLAPSRRQLLDLSQRLGDLRQPLAEQPAATAVAVSNWQVRLRARTPALLAVEARTLYAPTQLRARLAEANRR